MKKNDILNSESKLKWFNEARFGLFIHWGLYAIPARGEWVMNRELIPPEEYNKLADQFNPEKFDAMEWAKLAKQAGAKYMVLTARHHDGFCLFDSKVNDFNSVKTAAKRDFVAEYVDACRAIGLKVGIYYSIASWQWPAIHTGPFADPEGWKSLVDDTHAQLEELMSNYGKIDILWYDGAFIPGIMDDSTQTKHWRSAELNQMVRRHQPDILINDRSGFPEDISTPEQTIAPPAAGRTWEACMTMNQSWGYKAADKDFKSVQEIIQCLVRCARFGGNLLLNVGPKADGTIQSEFVERLQQVGEWMKINGEAIYNSRRTPYTEAEHVSGPVTSADHKIYFHLFDLTSDTIRIDGVTQIERAYILGNKKLLKSTSFADTGVDVEINEKTDSSDLPKVLALETSNLSPCPANCLGGGDTLRITAGDEPVLGADPDRHKPPQAPVISSSILGDMLQNRSATLCSPGESWCPGWHEQQVYSPKTSDHLELILESSADGHYDLELGLIGSKKSSIKVILDGIEICDKEQFINPGVPDTYKYFNLMLTHGKHNLKIQCKDDFGLYAMRVSMQLLPIPSENWLTIGPFPTGYSGLTTVEPTRIAMGTEFPPEKEFDPDAVYVGTDGMKVKWTHSNLREGEHTDQGVNFPFRCGMEPGGVCYARTTVISPEDRVISLLIGCDWWANAWFNDQKVISERPEELILQDGAQFSCWKPIPATVKLKKGRNVLLVKGHPGRGANWFCCFLSDPGDLRISVD